MAKEESFWKYLIKWLPLMIGVILIGKLGEILLFKRSLPFWISFPPQVLVYFMIKRMIEKHKRKKNEN